MLQVDKLKDVVKGLYNGPLPVYMQYHNWSHTQQVEEAALCIAQGEGVSGIDLLRVRSAVYLHDVGHLIARENHEQRSVQIAYSLLPLFGASASDLKVIDGLIMATAIPQKPHTLLEKIMCDADLSLMGYDAWFSLIDGYRQERGENDLKKWYQGQLAFLGSHTWFTSTAASLYGAQKQRNLERVKLELKHIAD